MSVITDIIAEDMVIKARVKTLMQLPFYGTLLCSLDYEEVVNSPTIKTMATDTKKIYYNPAFVKSLTQEEVSFVNVHEIMHVALGHAWRRGNRIHEIWNYACDYAINGLIKESIDKAERSNVLKMPQKVLYDEKYTGLNAEEIYDILIKQCKKPKPQDGNGGGDNGNGNNGDIMMPDLADKQFDDHSQWDKSDVQKDKEEKISEWEGKLADSASKHAGSTPKGINRYVKTILEPKRDWREILHEFLSQEVNDYSFSPPDRRFSDTLSLTGLQFFLPDYNETADAAHDILVMNDTSASISDSDIQEFYSELVGAINQFGGKFNGHVGFFDTKTYGPYPFESVDDVLDIIPQGGGGTCFTTVLNKCRSLIDNGELKVAGVIIFTDGECSYPEENPISDVPLLWVMNTNNEAPYGTTTSLRDTKI